MNKINIMHYMRTIILAGTAWLWISCGDSGHKHENELTKTETDQFQSSSQNSIKINHSALDAVWNHYEALTAALVAKDAEKAKLSAHALAEAASNIEGLNFMAAPAKAIAESSDLKVQRASFSILSNAYIEKIKAAGMENGVLYVDFCPMALNDNGGYWLSTEKTIINPYFGDEMLNCGTVKEEIGKN